MGQISKFLRSCEGGGLRYWCQGCEDLHGVQVGEGSGPRWGYNGNPDKPTFSPSVLTTYSANPDASDEFAEWRKERICHTFITDGQVQFLGDCTHELAGQTLPLPELPDYLKDPTP